MQLAAPHSRPTSAGWYLVAFGLLGIAIAIALTGYNQMNEVVETMQRRVMPGTHEMPFANGRTMIYYESQSRIGDQHYATPEDLTFQCSLRDLVGKPIDLRKVVTTTYSASDFTGRSVWEVEIAVPGNYVLSCDGRAPYVLAIGGGIGAWAIVAIAGGLVPGSAGLFVVVFVTLKRRRWHRRRA
jgi:hypothetical protein